MDLADPLDLHAEVLLAYLLVNRPRVRVREKKEKRWAA